MPDDDFTEAEVQDALETTNQLHADVSRLKRLGILSPEEDQVSKEHIEEISTTLEDKLPGAQDPPAED